MKRTSTGLIVPDNVTVPKRQVVKHVDVENELGLTAEGAQAFIDSNPAIQRDLKKARKAYARLQETIRHEAAALARSKGSKGEA